MIPLFFKNVFSQSSPQIPSNLHSEAQQPSKATVRGMALFPLAKPLPRLTDAVGLHAAPRQVGEAGPGGGALQQVSLLALEKDDASHLLQWETNL